jgi:hypothetical protein
MYRRSSEYADGIYSRAPIAPPQVNLLNLDASSLFAGPRFLYLWRP